MAEVYLDNSATTRVYPAAAQKAFQIMTEEYGNPSSLHTLGFRAEQIMQDARSRVADMLGAEAEEVVFTSGGTESNNLAVFGSTEAKKRYGKHIVTTAVEHSSISSACDRLEQQGYTVTRLVPAGDGTISADAIAEACREDTVLVAVMLVNNETGAQFPLDKAVKKIRSRSPYAHIHADGVQAFGKIPLNATRMGVDTLSVSAHKIHGPKGCGALYIRKGVRLIAQHIGGKQERGLRCGTECTPLIGAFGVAVEIAPSFEEQKRHYNALKTALLDGLSSLPVSLHLPSVAVPYIVNFSLIGYKSETVLHFLANKGIYVSSGSACSKGATSPVLTAMGISKAEADSALRISFAFDNTVDDIQALLSALQEAVTQLAKK